MKAAEAMIAWTPANMPDRLGVFPDEPDKRIAVGPLLGEGDADWTAPFTHTGGAAFTATRNMPEWQQIAMVFIEFHTAVVRDGVDPQAAHQAFLAIDEYRERIAPDIKGAA